MSIRLFGAGIVLESAMTISGNLTLRSGVTNYSANFSTTIAAGVYDLFTFAAKFNSLIRQALITNKHASITAPSLANVLFKVVFPTTWSSDPNANKLVMTFAPTGFLLTAGSLQTTITSFTINNAASHKVLTILGMVREVSTDSSGIVVYTPASPSATLATLTGLFQPRSTFCFENSIVDSWDNEVRPSEKTFALRNGKRRRHSIGSAEHEREITLVDLPAEETGPELDAMFFSSFSGSGTARSVINFQDPDDSGLTNVTDIHKNITLVAGDLVRIGNDDYWSMVTSISATQVLTAEAWPAAIVPTAGDVLWLISKAHALWIEAYRTEYFFVYEPDDSTGQSHFKATAYCLNLDGEHETQFERRDPYLTLFSVTFPLARRDTPEVVVI